MENQYDFKKEIEDALNILKKIPDKLPQVIKKVPGEIPPLPKKSSQGYIENLKEKKTFEIEELLERQKKLLANKKFIEKLPDKGAKILQFKEKLLKELDHRNQVEEAGKLLSRLNIASEGKLAMSELEWTGKYNEKPVIEKIVELDSDDDEDPLKIIAQPTGSGCHEKKIIQLQPEETLIKPSDLEEIKSFETEEKLRAEHIQYITSIVENPEHDKKKKSFLPYKTTKSNVHDPEKEKIRKKHKYWEVTAATPPLIIHGAVKTLDIRESLILQKEQEIRLQKVQANYAAERLMERLGKIGSETTFNKLGNYRDNKESDSESIDSEDEVRDDEDDDKKGTVAFQVDSIDL